MSNVSALIFFPFQSVNIDFEPYFDNFQLFGQTSDDWWTADSRHSTKVRSIISFCFDCFNSMIVRGVSADDPSCLATRQESGWFFHLVSNASILWSFKVFRRMLGEPSFFSRHSTWVFILVEVFKNYIQSLNAIISMHNAYNVCCNNCFRWCLMNFDHNHNRFDCIFEQFHSAYNSDTTLIGVW